MRDQHISSNSGVGGGGGGGGVGGGGGGVLVIRVTFDDKIQSFITADDILWYCKALC